jgi:Fic family protein
MSGREVPIGWQGRAARAWLPDPLAVRDLGLSERTVRRTEQAAAAARRGSDELPVRWEALARLLLRAEGVASSFIEGVQAPLADVAAAELDPTALDLSLPDPTPRETAGWVADNLAAVTAAVSEARHGPLTLDALHRWHRILMGDVGLRHGHRIGTFRDAQASIGGTSPVDAALVPPPPDHLGPLVADLIEFANRTDVDAVTQAAVSHAQFEVIHPYGDGNGRVGRVLIGWVLTRRLRLVSPPPVSVRIAVDRGGYLSGLTMFRLGDVDPWVHWFAATVGDAGDATVNLIRAIDALQATWRDRLSDVRADSAAHRLIAVLPEYPVLSAATAADALQATERASRTALETLAARGIVVPYRRASQPAGRPRRWWVAAGLLDLVTAWSRPG